MNHYWAEQYARQRFDQLLGEARGDQVVRMARRDQGLPTARPFLSALTRLRVRLVAIASILR